MADEILDNIYNGGRCSDCGDDNPLQAAVEQCCPRPQGSKNSSQMWGIDQFDITIQIDPNNAAAHIRSYPINDLILKTSGAKYDFLNFEIYGQDTFVNIHTFTDELDILFEGGVGGGGGSGGVLMNIDANQSAASGGGGGGGFREFDFRLYKSIGTWGFLGSVGTGGYRASIADKGGAGGANNNYRMRVKISFNQISIPYLTGNQIFRGFVIKKGTFFGLDSYNLTQDQKRNRLNLIKSIGYQVRQPGISSIGYLYDLDAAVFCPPTFFFFLFIACPFDTVFPFNKTDLILSHITIPSNLILEIIDNQGRGGMKWLVNQKHADGTVGMNSQSDGANILEISYSSAPGPKSISSFEISRSDKDIFDVNTEITLTPIFTTKNNKSKNEQKAQLFNLTTGEPGQDSNGPLGFQVQVGPVITIQPLAVEILQQQIKDDILFPEGVEQDVATLEGAHGKSSKLSLQYIEPWSFMSYYYFNTLKQSKQIDALCMMSLKEQGFTLNYDTRNDVFQRRCYKNNYGPGWDVGDNQLSRNIFGHSIKAPGGRAGEDKKTDFGGSDGGASWKLGGVTTVDDDGPTEEYPFTEVAGGAGNILNGGGGAGSWEKGGGATNGNGEAATLEKGGDGGLGKGSIIAPNTLFARYGGGGGGGCTLDTFSDGGKGGRGSIYPLGGPITGGGHGSDSTFTSNSPVGQIGIGSEIDATFPCCGGGGAIIKNASSGDFKHGGAGGNGFLILRFPRSLKKGIKCCPFIYKSPGVIECFKKTKYNTPYTVSGPGGPAKYKNLSSNQKNIILKNADGSNWGTQRPLTRIQRGRWNFSLGNTKLNPVIGIIGDNNGNPIGYRNAKTLYKNTRLNLTKKQQYSYFARFGQYFNR